MIRSARHQRGITLIVVLFLVVLVALVGMVAVRSLVAEERMIANSFDRNLAMQSAENLLREAETLAQTQSTASTVNAGFTASTNANLPNGSYQGTCSGGGSDPSPCSSGLCSQPSLGCTPRTEDAKVDWASGVVVGDATHAATGMQYLIEYLGRDFACTPNDPNDKFNCSQYRITVRSAPGTDRAFLQLQSYYLAIPP